jgi:uncharacterized protein
VAASRKLSRVRLPVPGARSGLLRALQSLLFVTLAVYVLVSLMLLLLQSRLIFFPTREIEATPAEAGLAYEDVWLTTDDGVRLHGWWVPAPRARGTVLFFHGNAGNISHRIGSVATFHRLGYNTLIFDYRGYGHSDGQPSEAGTYRDADAAWQHLVAERAIAPREIVLFGRSLGGAVAAALAERQTPAAVILESTFASVPALGAELYPFLPVRWLARIRYDTLARMPGITAPVLVVHSPDDDIIPFHHGRRLWEAAREPKEFLEISGTHNAGFVTHGRRYEEGLARFLARYGPGPAPPLPSP